MRNRTENQINLVWIRHGATAGNLAHRYIGRTQEALCPEGVKALTRAKAAGKYPPVDLLFCSPMERCIQTAQILYPKSRPICIANWREMDFGEFEGKNYKELQGNPLYQQWIDSNGTMPFPGGESREEFRARCREGFKEMMQLAAEYKPQAQTIGLLVHGGTIMALLQDFYGGDYYDYQVSNGEGYVCSFHGSGDAMTFDALQKLGGCM